LVEFVDDRQGVEAIKIVQPKTVIPINYNDYDVFKSPLEDFKRAAERRDFLKRSCISRTAKRTILKFLQAVGNSARRLRLILRSFALKG